MGWNSKPDWEERFPTDAPNLTDYGAWEKWHTSTRIFPAEVDDGKCQLSIGPQYGFSGAVTSSVHVPFSHFTGAGLRRNKWTVVMDYHAKVEYDPIGAHAGVFMRVHNNRKYWDTDADPPQCLNETTRFGCYMSGGPSGEEFQGAIQLDGDQASGNPKCPLKKKRYLRFFELDENPFDNPGNVYRI